MAEKIEKTKMIELNIQMDESMTYNVCIPEVITAQTFPEIIRRLRSILSIIPKKELIAHKKGTLNPLMYLSLQESKELFNLYKTESKKDFIHRLSSEYKIEQDSWKNVVAMIGRVKNRIKKLESELQ